MKIARIQELLPHAEKKGLKPTIAVAAADDVNALETVSAAREKNLAQAILVGNRDQIEQTAEETKVDLSGFSIIDATDYTDAADKALQSIKSGSCEILMKGSLPTSTLMKKVVEKEYGLRTERILSHTAVFNAPNDGRLLLLTDAGINIAPDMTRKRDIILNAVRVAHALGIRKPKVAVLSYVEKKSHLSERSVADAVVLTEMNKAGKIPGCIVDGPFALDNAISPESARIKKIESDVAGQADILVAHDLHMGNAMYKALQVWGGVTLAGVVVGSKMPIILTSRADSKDTKFYSLVLAIFLAGGPTDG